jgi:hypothetical protein
MVPASKAVNNCTFGRDPILEGDRNRDQLQRDFRILINRKKDWPLLASLCCIRIGRNAPLGLICHAF